MMAEVKTEAAAQNGDRAGTLHRQTAGRYLNLFRRIQSLPPDRYTIVLTVPERGERLTIRCCHWARWKSRQMLTHCLDAAARFGRFAKRNRLLLVQTLILIYYGQAKGAAKSFVADLVPKT